MAASQQRGTPERFEIDFKPLGRYLSVSVYSPAKGYFVAVFDDITARKVAEANQALLTDILQALNRGDDQHALIAETLRLIRHATGFRCGRAAAAPGRGLPLF